MEIKAWAVVVGEGKDEKPVWRVLDGLLTIYRRKRDVPSAWT